MGKEENIFPSFEFVIISKLNFRSKTDIWFGIYPSINPIQSNRISTIYNDNVTQIQPGCTCYYNLLDCVC